MCGSLERLATVFGKGREGAVARDLIFVSTPRAVVGV